jgi:hypothetical protein
MARYKAMNTSKLMNMETLKISREDMRAPSERRRQNSVQPYLWSGHREQCPRVPRDGRDHLASNIQVRQQTKLHLRDRG